MESERCKRIERIQINGNLFEKMAHLAVEGDQAKKERLYILTRFNNHHALTDRPVKYVKLHDLAIVDITCPDIRAFYSIMN
jgi:hypothetical protein